MMLLASLSCGGGSNRAGKRVFLALQVEALDGGTVDLASYRGRVVILHLFTTWSLAAQGDLPQLVELDARYREQVSVLGVGLDPDGYRLVAPWRQANQIPYLVTLGLPDLLAGKSSLGPITHVPTTIVLDRDGLVTARIDGPLQPGQLARILAQRGIAPAPASCKNDC